MPRGPGHGPDAAVARLPRLDLPGIPQHVVQRGNNRLPCFLDDQDRRSYLGCLGDALAATGVALHAYVLMGNHVHLLLTPPEAGATGRMMQLIGRHYVGWFNTRHGRTGTLWEGRYKACLVDSEAYLLRCSRYIDLNPVRARIVVDPMAYGWSSCAALCGLVRDPLLTPHASQLSLGGPGEASGPGYARWLREGVADEEAGDIRRFLKQQRAWGSEGFQRMVELKSQRFADVRPAHRPVSRRT